MEPFRAADHVAMELQQAQRNPQIAQLAMQEIRQDLYQMRPNEALAFERRLNQDLGGRSPLHERPEVVQGPQGQPMRTGGELLVMTDPFRPQMGEQVVKRVGPEFCNEGQRPGYPQQGFNNPGYINPGYQPGYGQPGYGQPGYGQPSIGIGIGVGGRHNRLGIGVVIP
jgi:hypothetical protein